MHARWGLPHAPPPSPRQGVWEKDEVRREDSFEAFDEVLQLATKWGADAVLLGGDLFHENKPSRSTLVKAMETIKRHCMNDKPVPFQIVSDPSVNFVSGCAHAHMDAPMHPMHACTEPSTLDLPSTSCFLLPLPHLLLLPFQIRTISISPPPTPPHCLPHPHPFPRATQPSKLHGSEHECGPAHLHHPRKPRRPLGIR